ncbi:MAG: hypothetical protein PHP64_05625 [Actinomycetota bacterium]|nr:hypothetical protein [Actinomycetota bacterium]
MKEDQNDPNSSGTNDENEEKRGFSESSPESGSPSEEKNMRKRDWKTIALISVSCAAALLLLSTVCLAFTVKTYSNRHDARIRPYFQGSKRPMKRTPRGWDENNKSREWEKQRQSEPESKSNSKSMSDSNALVQSYLLTSTNLRHDCMADCLLGRQ